MARNTRSGGATAAGVAIPDRQLLVPNTDVTLTGTSNLTVPGDLNVVGDVNVTGGVMRRIGYAGIASNFTTASTTYTDITGGSLTVTIPDSGNLLLVAWLPLLVEEAIAGQAAVASGARSSGTVTMNTSAAHGFTTGEIVTVTVADTTYNGTYVVTVTDADTFTYSQSALGNDASSGTGVAGKTGNVGGGADIRLVTGAGPTVITADSTPRAQFANQPMSFFLRAELPASTHTPTPGTEVTYKLQAKSTHATSDLSVFVDFAGPQNVAYLAAWAA